MVKTTLNLIEQEKVCVIDSLFDLKQDLHKRLIEMGFVTGAKISVIKNKKRAKIMLISIRGYLLSLDYFIAQRVSVVA